MLPVVYGELCVQYLGGLMLCHDLDSPGLRHFESCIFRTIVIFLHLPCFTVLCWSLSNHLWRDNPIVQRQHLIPKIHWPLKSLQSQNCDNRASSCVGVSQCSASQDQRQPHRLFFINNCHLCTALMSHLGLPYEAGQTLDVVPTNLKGAPVGPGSSDRHTWEVAACSEGRIQKAYRPKNQVEIVLGLTVKLKVK